MTRWLSLVAVVLSLCTAPASAQVEPAQFLRCWQQAQEGKPNWDGFIEVYGQHELAGVAKLLAAVEKVKAGDEKAGELFAFADPPADKVDYVGVRLAFAGRSWRSRLQMAGLEAKLKAYHRKKIEYPATLAMLIDAGYAEKKDTLDSFGRAFEYHVGARTIMPGVSKQMYKLSCSTTGVTSDALGKTLETIYAPCIEVTVSSLRPQDREVYVKFRQPDGSYAAAARWMPGQSKGVMHLVAVYDKFIVLFVGDTPKVVTPP